MVKQKSETDRKSTKRGLNCSTKMKSGFHLVNQEWEDESATSGEIIRGIFVLPFLWNHFTFTKIKLSQLILQICVSYWQHFERVSSVHFLQSAWSKKLNFYGAENLFRSIFETQIHIHIRYFKSLPIATYYLKKIHLKNLYLHSKTYDMGLK